MLISMYKYILYVYMNMNIFIYTHTYVTYHSSCSLGGHKTDTTKLTVRSFSKASGPQRAQLRGGTPCGARKFRCPSEDCHTFSMFQL